MIIKFKVQYLTIIEFLQEFMDANSPDANIFNENNQRTYQGHPGKSDSVIHLGLGAI